MCCFRKKSRACDKLLMELCFVSSSQRTNEQCREPLAARSYWTHARGLHGELAGWDSATAGATFSGLLLSACADAQPCESSRLPWGHLPPWPSWPPPPRCPLPLHSPMASASLPPPRSSLSPASQGRRGWQELSYPVWVLLLIWR